MKGLEGAAGDQGKKGDSGVKGQPVRTTAVFISCNKHFWNQSHSRSVKVPILHISILDFTLATQRFSNPRHMLALCLQPPFTANGLLDHPNIFGQIQTTAGLLPLIRRSGGFLFTFLGHQVNATTNLLLDAA